MLRTTAHVSWSVAPCATSGTLPPPSATSSTRALHAPHTRAMRAVPDKASAGPTHPTETTTHQHCMHVSMAPLCTPRAYSSCTRQHAAHGKTHAPTEAAQTVTRQVSGRYAQVGVTHMHDTPPPGSSTAPMGWALFLVLNTIAGRARRKHRVRRTATRRASASSIPVSETPHT